MNPIALLKTVSSKTLATSLISAGVGGMAVNVLWGVRTKKFLDKRHAEVTQMMQDDYAEIAALRLFINSISNLARDSKTMSRADKEEIEKIREMSLVKLDSESKKFVFKLLEQKVDEWKAEFEAREQTSDEPDATAA